MKLYKYSATTWHCASCISLGKLLDTVDLGDKELVEVDIDTLSRDELQKKNIRGVPVLILTDSDGNELKRMQGLPSKEKLEQFLDLPISQDNLLDNP